MKIVVFLILLGQAYISWRTFKILPFPVWGKWMVAVDADGACGTDSALCATIPGYVELAA